MRSVSRPAGSVSGALLAVGGALPDLCCVIAFIMIGRASHTEGETLAGLARTAWPFLSGLTVGWLVTRAWQRPAALFPVGVGGWLATVVVGMLLRAASGQGTAFAFMLVALVFLGLFMIGWRVLARWAASTRARRSA